MGYSRIEVEPLAGACGAEIGGVDLAKLDDETFAEIHQAFLEHVVVFFREQRLTPEEHKAFGRRFGPLQVHPFAEPLEGHREVLPVVKEPEDRLNFGGGWHTDVTFLERPALGSILYALQVPDRGGDTLWANQYLAYESLSPGMKRLLDGVKAVHSAGEQYGSAQSYSVRAGGRGMSVTASEDAHQEVLHPVVRTHPESGRKSLFVNRAFTMRFEGMSRAESKPLLDFLCDRATYEPFTCRFRWTEGAVAFWDNRCTQHFALNDYPGERRVMHRVTIEGDRPV